MLEAPPHLPRISDYVAWRAERSPDAEAAVLAGTRWSYGELAKRIDGLAAALWAAGVRKGDRVATLQTPHPDFLTAFLATASLGAIWVGLNPRYRLGELLHVLRDSAPRVLLTRTRVGDRLFHDDVQAIRAAVPTLERVVVFDGEPASPGASPMAEFLSEAAVATDEDALTAARTQCGGRDPCLIVYTSGSTGAPKGALLHHDALSAFCLQQNRLWPTRPQRCLNYFPINHIGAVVDVSLPALVDGGTVVFMEQFDPSESLRLMEEERITLWGSVPSVFQMQLASPDFARRNLSAVQLIVWEGAAMPEEVGRQLVALGRPLATNYSMTEATGITLVDPTSDLDVLLGSVGGPFPDVEIRLTDDQGADVSPGEAGEVWVRSPYLFRGYWNNPEATAEAFTPDGYFRTGDLGVRRPDGRYKIVGRLKEMYKSGGYNVYPREVEAVIEAHPGVALAAVVGAPDPVWQEVGVAYVQPHVKLSPSELDTWCRERLANYKRPKRFVIEAELPLLPIGKVDKRALKRRAAEGR